MHFLPVALLASTAVATAAPELITLRAHSKKALEGVFKRQFQSCGSVPVGTPNPCAVACGAGYQTCVSLPTCYNPTKGDTCCSDGKYCPAGYYCTDGGCCPNGTPLSQCGATKSLGTIAPSKSATPQTTQQQSSATYTQLAPAPSITYSNSSVPAPGPTIAVGEGAKLQTGKMGALLGGLVAAMAFF